MQQEEFKLLLTKMRRAELESLAAQVGVNFPAGATKRTLISHLLTAPQKKILAELKLTWWAKSKSDFFLWSGWVIAVLSLMAGFWIYQMQKEDQRRNEMPKDASIGLSWYELKEGHPSLLGKRPIKMVIDEETMRTQSIKIPVNLAIRNSGADHLEVVSVQISYPDWLEVKSSGRGQIDPDQRLIVYQHQIGTLPPVDTFTPLTNIDTLTLPYSVLIVPTIVKYSDGVPGFHLITAGYPRDSLAGKAVPLQIRVDCKGHKPVKGTLTINVPFGIDFIDPDDKLAKTHSLSAEEAGEIEKNIGGDYKTLSEWSGIYKRDGSNIRYLKMRLADRVCQVIRVDEVVRRVYVDMGADGTCDFECLDSNGDGKLDDKIVHSASYPMFDWLQSALNDK